MEGDKMRRIILALYIVLLASTVHAQMLPFPTSGGGGTANPVLFTETFSGSTLCYTGQNSACDNTWSYEQGCTFASRSLSIPAGSANYAYVNFTTSATTLYFAARASWGTGTSPTIMVIEDSSGNTLANAWVYTDSQVGVSQTGGASAYVTGTWAQYTYYDFKIMVTVGTGSNAQAKVAWSPAGTNSWTWTTLSTNGTWTAQPARLEFISSSSTYSLSIEKIEISTSDITNF
jgi:hypothetical protein